MKEEKNGRGNERTETDTPLYRGVEGGCGKHSDSNGWVQKRRNLGSLIFVDLRDRSGLLQIIFDEKEVGTAGFEKAGTLRSEFVIAVVGEVQLREGAVNESMKTGEDRNTGQRASDSLRGGDAAFPH